MVHIEHLHLTCAGGTQEVAIHLWAWADNSLLDVDDHAGTPQCRRDACIEIVLHVLQYSSDMHHPEKTRMSLVLREATARCRTVKSFIFFVMHVRRNLQYLVCLRSTRHCL